MNKKLMLLALSAVSAVLFALPAVGSAAEWHMTPGSQNITGSSVGNTVLTASNGDTVTCTSATGTGTSNAEGNGGTINLKFHGCTSAGFACTTSGQSSGTILASGNWTSVYLTDAKTDPGIKIEGPSHGTLSTFSCFFGAFAITVSGSVIGDIEESCNAEDTEFSMDFEAIKHGEQKYMQNTATGTKTDLTVVKNGTASTGAQDGTGILKMAQKTTLVCT